jgi:acyl-coenzyme A thioesterase PaaI-like protein
MSDHGDELPRSIRIEGMKQLEVTPARREARRLAEAMREVTSLMVCTTADVEQLAAAADEFEAFAEQLRGFPGGHTYEGYSEAANAGAAVAAYAAASDTGDPERFASFDFSPLIGQSNPLAPPIVMDHEEGTERAVVARVTFGPAYEGPPGCVHGGFVAASFDEVLGATQSLSGTQGMTAHLDVDYRKPTPLGVPLVMRGWLDRTEGRKIWARAELRDGDTLCAEAEALFIAFAPGGFQKLLEDRGILG